jgi:hypothetical protein
VCLVVEGEPEAADPGASLIVDNVLIKTFEGIPNVRPGTPVSDVSKSTSRHPMEVAPASPGRI